MALDHYPDKRGMGVFATRQDAEYALRELRDANFPMSTISIMARDPDQIAGVNVQEDRDNQAAEGAAAGAVAGGVTGGIIGLIGALSAIAIPGAGPILVGGALVSVIGTTLAGGAVGTAAGGLLGALIGIGVPEAEAQLYHDRLEQGGYLLIVDGTLDDLRRAASILTLRGIQEWRIYDISPATTTAPVYPTSMGTMNVGYPTALGTTSVGVFGEPLGGPPTTVTPVSTTATSLSQTQQAVGVFSNYSDLDKALNSLKAAGFEMNRVSVIAQDAGRHDRIAGASISELDDNKAGEGAATGVVAGGAIGGLTGLLVGLGSLAIPGLGPMVFAGEATAIASILTGGAVGAAAGGLIGVLVGIGIPEDRAKIYIDRLANGEYLVLVEGTEAQIRLAESVLRDGGIQEWGIYNNPSAPMTSPGRVFP